MKQQLPNVTLSLINKRRTYFMEFLGTKRKNSRIDVYMQWLKDFSGKQIYDIDDKDVLDFSFLNM